MTPAHWRLGVAAALVAMACGGDSPVQSLPVCTLASAQTITLAVGQYRTIDPATTSGCFGFPANASTTDSAEYLLVPWSAARAPQESTTFVLASPSTRTSAQFVSLRRAPRLEPRSIAREFDAFRRRAARTGRWGPVPGRAPALSPLAAARASTLPLPGSCGALTLGKECQFIVCDTVTCQTTVTIVAQLQALGQKVAIFVDEAAPSGGLDSADLDTLKQTLETRLYQLDINNFGTPSDIDGNGHVIVLMTPIVNALVSTEECNTVGFILGFFFGADLDPRFNFMFNRGEVYYSLVADSAGTYSCPHSRLSVKRLSPRTFVHELQHLINYSAHVVGKTPGTPPEEGWLDEGLATYAEEIAGRTYLDPTYTNVPQPDTLTYRRFLAFGDMLDAWYYLSSPEESYLEIPEDNGSAGEIGASWLFVRYLMDRFGPGLAMKLVQSGTFGSANVAAQTGTDFTTLVNQWALTNYLNDYPGFPTPPELKYTSWQFRSAFDTLQTSVRGTFGDSVDFTPPYPLEPMAYPASSLYLGGTLRAGTGFYVRALQGPKDPAFALGFTTPTYTALPASMYVRLNIVRMR